MEKASELRPDLVLMDIHLEGAMDGIKAAGQIHADCRIPVVFLTAYAEDETLRRAQASLPTCFPSELHDSVHSDSHQRSRGGHLGQIVGVMSPDRSV